MKLSIILPTFNESKRELLGPILKQLTDNLHPDMEIIVADAGSSDDTLFIASSFPAIKVVCSVGGDRTGSINQAIKSATGDLVLLHHPHAMIPTEAIQYLIENGDSLIWGGLTHQYDSSNPWLKFFSWYSNTIRARWRGVIHLDHCIFARRRLLQVVGPFESIESLEDVRFSHKLMGFGGRPKLLPFEATQPAPKLYQSLKQKNSQQSANLIQ